MNDLYLNIVITHYNYWTNAFVYYVYVFINVCIAFIMHAFIKCIWSAGIFKPCKNTHILLIVLIYYVSCMIIDIVYYLVYGDPMTQALW